MRVICAWCKQLMGYKCPFCGSPLTQDPKNKSRLLCQSGETAIHFGTEGMKETHGICEACATALTEAKLIADEIAANAKSESRAEAKTQAERQVKKCP